MVIKMLLVKYKCPVKEIEGVKVPDVPEHIYHWRINNIKTKYDEYGNIVEYFEVTSEMSEEEFEKIKPYIEVIKVMQL